MNIQIGPDHPDYNRLYRQWLNSGKPWYLDDYRGLAYYHVYRLDDQAPVFFLISSGEQYTEPFRVSSFSRRPT